MRHRGIKWVIAGAVGASAAAGFGGCAVPRVNTTMLTAADVVRMTDLMAESLNRSPAIARRTPAEPRWVFTMDRVTNRTEHPLDDSEKWGIMARFRARLTASDVARDRAVSFVLPASEWERYAKEYFDPEQARLRPTHALRAEFRSDTRSALGGRDDAYLCAFQLLDLESGVIVWEDAYEVKYRVLRNSFD